MTQKELTDSLDLASRQYYQGLTTQYTDTEFDLLLKELQRMEKESGIVLPNSPTQRVGSDIQKGFKKGKHPLPMLTIENTYNDEGLQEWINKTHKMLLEMDPMRDETYTVGTKFDGVSLEVKYENGVMVQALTRGDKNIGDDVTENAKTIRDIPLQIEYKETFYVRGEVMLPKSRLDAINKEREANGEEKFANSRNACSGSLKQLNPKITAKRGLIFRAWDCIGEPIYIRDMEQKMELLEQLGFKTGEVPCKTCTFADVVKTANKVKEALDTSHVDYDYDGVVIKINQCDIQTKIGTKDTRAIEWGIARKWNEDVVETVLLGVDWQVGRTGVLTPVARLEPVECGGVTVSNATLHNLSFIRKNDIMLHDWLKIVRSGDVIPYVEGVDTDLREGGVREPISAPEKCPICGGELEYDGELIKCTNVDCAAKITGKIIQFCSKEGMDIKSIGERTVEDLVKNNLVRNYWDLYTLENCQKSYIIALLGEGYGEVSVSNILKGIEDSKNRPFENVLAALSIPGVGKVTGRLLAYTFLNVDVIANLSVDELMEVDGIGEVMANDIYNWFHSSFGEFSVAVMKAYGLNTSVETNEADDEIPYRPLEGLKVCFTGSSDWFKGDGVEEYLESLGAKCTHSVSSKLDYLIVGNKPGTSKVEKAQQFGVELIEEDMFYERFEIKPS